MGMIALFAIGISFALVVCLSSYSGRLRSKEESERQLLALLASCECTKPQAPRNGMQNQQNGDGVCLPLGETDDQFTEC